MDFDQFVTALHSALKHLYEPQFLRKSPIVTRLFVGETGDNVQTVRKTLTDSIRLMKPNLRAPMESSEYRTYHILVSRFIDQAGQKEVSLELNVSDRQFRRLEQEAVRMLGENLWAKFPALPQNTDGSHSADNTDAVTVHSGFESGNSEFEIERLRTNFFVEKVELGALFRSIQKTLSPLSQLIGVDIEYNLPKNELFVTGKTEILRQVLLNLITASAQSSLGGKVTIGIQNDPQTTQIKIIGENSSKAGPPLSAEVIENIQFTSRLVDAFEGSLTTQTPQNETIKLISAFKIPSASVVNIFAIEDNTDVIKLYDRYLSGTNYSLFSCSDPSAVILTELINSVQPQVILLDVMMPTCDGWEILGQLREHPDTRHIPIIVCSILPQKSLAFSLGAMDYLRKPVKRQIFLNALDLQMGKIKKKS